MRIFALIAVVVWLVSVTTSANASIDDDATFTPVGFSIHFGHQSDRHDHKHRKHHRYKSYGYGYSRFPGYRHYRFQKHGWSRHGHKYRHHGKHHRKHRRHRRY